MDDDIRLLSEDYRQSSDAFPTLVSALRQPEERKFRARRLGVALGEGKRPSFDRLRSHVAKDQPAELVLMLTDLLHDSGKDLSTLPLSVRRTRLSELVDGAPHCLALSASLRENARS